MKTIRIGRWTLPVAGAAAVAVTALAFSMPAAQAADTKEVHVKQASIADHAGDCADGGIVGAHLVLNQISSGPASIDVVLADDSEHVVAKSKQSGPVAHYDVWFTETTVADATAVVPSTWRGQFVLSHYYCGTTTTTTGTPTTGTPTTGTPTRTS